MDSFLYLFNLDVWICYLEGSQLLLVYQLELLDEVDEVLEGGVEMGLLPQGHDLLHHR